MRVFLDLLVSLRATVAGLCDKHDGTADVIAYQSTALYLGQLGICLDLGDHLSENAHGIEARLTALGGWNNFGQFECVGG